jgi:hypothetical protein
MDPEPMGRPKVLGVLTATVLIAALVVTGRVQAGSGRRLSTHADQGHATAAPSPAGRAELGGVQLVPTPSGLRRQCREAANLLGFAVPCPMLLPASSPGVVPRRFCDPRFLCVPGDGFLFEERRLVVPPDSLGVDGQGRGRLAIAAATRVAAFPVACLGGRKVATIEVRGTRGNLFECSPQAGAHLGGVLLRWREAGVVMAVSLHGHNQLNRRLVVALAANMEAVPPSRGTPAKTPAAAVDVP